MNFNRVHRFSCRLRDGFTLTELLVVVTLIVAMMMILLPALEAFRQGRVERAANNQLVADLNNARHKALLNGSPVYMVFFPKWSDFSEMVRDAGAGAAHAKAITDHVNSSKAANNRMGGQQTIYALYAEGAVGDQPTYPASPLSIKNKSYVSEWKRLPAGAFFQASDLRRLRVLNKEMESPDGRWVYDEADNRGNRYAAPRPRGLDGEYGSNAPNGAKGLKLSLELPLPYIGFGPRGQVVGVRSGLVMRGEKGLALGEGTGFFSMEIASGSVLPPEKDKQFGFYLLQDGDDEEEQPGTAKYNRVRVNVLTGRSESNVCDVYWIRSDPTANKRWSSIQDSLMSASVTTVLSQMREQHEMGSVMAPDFTQVNPMLLQGVGMEKARLFERLLLAHLRDHQGVVMTDEEFRWELKFN